MKKLQAIIFAVLITTFAPTAVMAGSESFAGPYLGIMATVNGGEADGKVTNSNNNVSNGSLGKVYGTVGLDLGWNLPIGDNFILGVGGSWKPANQTVSVDVDSDAADHDITLKVKDSMQGYISMGISTSENAMTYIKFGHVEQDIALTGDVKNTPSSINGWIAGFGTQALFESGAFFKTELGVENYKKLDVEKSSTTGNASIDPLVAYGGVTLGYRF